MRANKKIVITGGHMTPALGVMEELKKRGWECIYIGRKHALEGDSAISQEYQMVTKLGYPFKILISGRVPRRLTGWGLLSLFKMPLGFIQAFYYLLNLRPSEVLSFGGYVGVPVAFWAWVLQIPVVIHEQTFKVGLANKLIGRLAQKICVAWNISYAFDPHKIVVTGNPLRQDIFAVRQGFEIELTKPLLYVTGGNLGAHAINILILETLEKLLQKYAIIHQCGNSQEFKDYERLNSKKNQLPASLTKSYLPIPFIDNDHIGWVYDKAKIVLSRAGANTLSEVIALGKPTLFIPLPWSGGGEQDVNARFLSQRSAALMVDQNTLTPQNLENSLDELFKNRLTILEKLHAVAREVGPDAAKKIANVVESVA